MTSTGFDAATASRLESLTRVAPDPVRSERTRLHCRAQLLRRQQRRHRAASTARFARRVLTAVAVGGFCAFCALYVGSLVETTLRFERAFR
jgi:hypothetical protein